MKPSRLIRKCKIEKMEASRWREKRNETEQSKRVKGETKHG
jgi:hypothetical protein